MKERITITIEKEFLEWLDKKTDLKVFANRSHGFEFLIKCAQLRDGQKNESGDENSKRRDDSTNEGAQ